MPDFRLQNNFPIADVINATQRKGQLDNETALQSAQLFNQSLQAIGQVGQSLYDTKKRVAQSLALGRQFDIPDDVAKTMDPSQILQVATIKKGNIDMNTLLNILHPGSGGTAPVVPVASAPTSDQLGAAAPRTPTNVPLSMGPKPEAVLASTSSTIPMPAHTEPAASMPFGGVSTAPVSAPVPVPVPAPPLQPKTVNAATAKLAMSMRPVPVVTAADAIKNGTVQKGTIIKDLPRGNSTDQVSWATATPQQQSLAQAMYEGRVRPSDIGFRDRGKVTLLANEYATQNGLPPFRSYNADVNATMAKYATSGKLGQNALSLNTALGHAASAYDSYQAIGNTNEKWLNTPINVLRKQTNDPNVVALGINLNALQGELANVFKNSGATDQEISHWQKYLNEDLTPSQFNGALAKIDDLLKSRLSAMDYQRSQAGGGNGAPLISPHAKEISRRLSKGDNSKAAVTPNGTTYTVNP